MHLQPADHRILKELVGWSETSFPSGSLNLTVSELTKRTGLHRNTAQRRLAALRSGGVVEGFMFEPRPGVVGLTRAGHHFADLPLMDVAAFEAALAPFPNVSIAALHAQSCFLHTWHQPGAVAADVEQIRDALGATSARASFIMEEPPEIMTGLERRIMLALRRMPRRSVQAVADAAGTTRRTAARHIDGLVARQAGAFMPVFRAGRIEGEVVAVYDLSEWTDASYPSLRTAFPERIMGPLARGVRPMAMVPLPSIQAATERLMAAQRLPGLEHLGLRLVRDFLFPEACDRWLAERVQNAPPLATSH